MIRWSMTTNFFCIKMWHTWVLYAASPVYSRWPPYKAKYRWTSSGPGDGQTQAATWPHRAEWAQDVGYPRHIGAQLGLPLILGSLTNKTGPNHSKSGQESWCPAACLELCSRQIVVVLLGHVQLATVSGKGKLMRLLAPFHARCSCTNNCFIKRRLMTTLLFRSREFLSKNTLDAVE